MFLTRFRQLFTSGVFVCLILLGVIGCAPAKQNSATYDVSNASIRTPMAGRTVTAGYFDFKNNSAATVTIVGVSGDVAASIEMHTIKKIDDQMRMRPLPEVSVAPGAEANFISGGNHLMLFDVQLGDSPSILKIELANGVIVEAPFQHTQLIDSD